MLDNGLSKRLAIQGVLGGLGERALRETDGSGSNEGAGDVEGAHRDLEAVSRGSKDLHWSRISQEKP